MNVYFVAKNYIKEDCFEYLIDVLKVDTVFSFIDVDLMSDSLRRQLGRKLARYKRYLPIDGDVRDFIKKCVNNIVEGAAHLHKEDGRFKYKDLDSYAKSHYDTPINNLTDTDDRNVMIICNMHYRDITLHKSVPIFHSVTRVIENERYSYNYMQYFVDASMETALYTYNKIKKSLGTDKYRERICFVRFGRNIEEIFFKTHWTYNRNNENGEKWKADRCFSVT